MATPTVTVTCEVGTLAARPLRNKQLLFRLVGTGLSTAADVVVAPRDHIVDIPETGSFNVEIWPNDLGSSPTRYDVYIASNPRGILRQEEKLGEMQVTGAGGALADLLATSAPGATRLIVGTQILRDDAADLIADNSLGYTGPNREIVSAGDVVSTREDGFNYVVAADGAADAHLSTAGGVELYVQQGVDGFDIRAFGIPVNDSAATAGTIQSALNAASAASLPLVIPASARVRFGDAVNIPTQTVIRGEGTLTYTGTNHAFTTTGNIQAFDVEGVSLVGSSTNRMVNIAHNCELFRVEGVEARSFDKLADADTATDIERVEIKGSYFHTCGSGFEIDSNQIGSALVTENRFQNFSRATQILCVRFGSDDTTQQNSRGDYIVTNNTFKNIVSTGTNVEVHAAILYGIRAVISNNTVETLYNAGTEDCEALYTKCRYATITGNTTTDAARANDGSIAIKGVTRTGTTAPFGYGCTVTGNVVRGDGTTAGQNGIYIQNESVTCTGNFIEGCTQTDITIVAINGAAVNITGNTIARSFSQFGIDMILDTNDVNISDNIFSEWEARAGQLCAAINIQTGTVGQSGLSITNNRVSLLSTSTATAAWGVYVDTENDGSTFRHIQINHNNVDTSSASAGRGIFVGGEETINDMTILGNIVSADGIRELTVSGTVDFAGGVRISGNVFGDTYLDANNHNLDYEFMGRALIYTGTSAQAWVLPRAVVGATFRLTNRNTTGAAVGFAGTGSDTFIGGNTQATIADEGTISVECSVAGSWDVITATSAVTYA